MQMQRVLDQYILGGEIVEVSEYGNGHINKTYLVEVEGGQKYILQQINTNVFKKPQDVMKNIELVTEHIRMNVAKKNQNPSRSALEIVPTINFNNYLRLNGNYWRLYRYISGAKTYEQIVHVKQFYEVGKAVGRFQNQLIDFPIEELAITIPDFHHTPKRYQFFLGIAEADRFERGLDVYNEILFVNRRRNAMGKIIDLLESGVIPYRVTHNDTKLNNVMLDEETDEAICLIDMDTVMPGSILFDYGDAIRIGASTAVEDEKDLSKISINLDLFKNFTKGFLEEAGHLLVKEELELLVESVRIITLELGMRFLTDYLDGDRYFRVHYDTHNLVRAKAQFQLVRDLEDKAEQMNQIVKDILEDLKL